MPYPALTCEVCGGNALDKDVYCVKCESIATTFLATQGGPSYNGPPPIEAQLCDDCGSVRGNDCVKCDSPVAMVQSYLCENCGDGDKVNKCFICGKSV